jgi:hypothetical protein
MQAPDCSNCRSRSAAGRSAARFCSVTCTGTIRTACRSSAAARFPATGSTCTFPSRGWTRKNYWHGRSRRRISRSGPSSSATAGPSTPLSPGTMSSKASRCMLWRSRIRAAARSVTGLATVPPRWLTFQITARSALPRTGTTGWGCSWDAIAATSATAPAVVHLMTRSAALTGRRQERWSWSGR